MDDGVAVGDASVVPADSPEVARLRALVVAPKPTTSLVQKGLFFILSLGFFVWSSDKTNGVAAVAILVGVLSFHELGHWVAMRAFGYRDLRVFFIPFMGAAVSGRPTHASAAREAITSLAGPLPGIFLGLVLSRVDRLTGDPLGRSLVMQLLVINALNLAPVLPLDGGRVFEALFAGRNVWLSRGLAVVSVLGVAAFSVKWVDPMFASIPLILVGSMLVHRDKLLVAAATARQTHPEGFAPTLEHLPAVQFEVLARAVASTGTAKDTPAAELGRLEELHRLVRFERLRLTRALVVFIGWAGGGVLALLGLVFVMLSPSWRSFEGKGVRLELPSAPAHSESPGSSFETAWRGQFYAGFERVEATPDTLGRIDLDELAPRLVSKTPGATIVELRHVSLQGQDAVSTIERVSDTEEVRELMFKTDDAFVRVFVRSDGRYQPWAERVIGSVERTALHEP